MNGLMQRCSRFVAVAFAIVAVLGALDGCLVTCLSESAPAETRTTEAAPPCHHASAQAPSGRSLQADASCREHHHAPAWFEASPTVRVASPAGLSAEDSSSAVTSIDCSTTRSCSVGPPGVHSLPLTAVFAPLRI